MKLLNIDIPDRNKGPYLSQRIRELIQSGDLVPGEKVPSLRLLSEQLGLHRHTIKNSFDDLVAEGWIHSIPRSGYFISMDIPSHFLAARKEQNKKISPPFSFPIEREVSLPTYSPNEECRYNFQSGLPDTRLLNTKEMKRFYNLALNNLKDFSYGDTLGHGPLIEGLEDYLRRIRKVTEKNIAVTNGSQEALFIISQLLLKKGDSILVDEVGYAPARATFEMAGAKVLPMKTFVEQINFKLLEKIVVQNKVKALFLTPLHHFPTCKILSASQRMKLYELCEKHDLFIIEDDYDHEIHFAPPPAPIASNDPSQRVIYLSTFSKAIHPAIRLGFIALPPSLTKNFSEYRRILTHQNERLSQEFLSLYLQSGALERHLRRVRREYQKRRDLMVKTLRSFQNEGKDIEFEVPQGGLALWLNTKRNSTLLAEKAKTKGLYLLPESNFHQNLEDGTHLRLGFSNQNEVELREGLFLLKSFLK